MSGCGPRHPNCAALAIGSVPHEDAAAAVDFMLGHKPVCPAWPQMPNADFRENMYTQFTECMPAAVIETANRRIYFDEGRAPEEMAVFYESYLTGDVDFCELGPDYARGLHELMTRRLPDEAEFIKGQVTGPSSFGLTVADSGGKPVLYHGDLFEAVVKALSLKGRWQAIRFKEKAPLLTPVVFFDEPYLTQVGSALISLSPEQVAGYLNECYAAVHGAGMTGTHVCGGTDWGLLAATDVDILHFDAAGHAREFFLYEKEIAAFMERGGMLAWGIVPNDETAFKSSAELLAEQVLRGAEKVAAFGPADLGSDEVLKRSFVSEACGVGSLSLDLAERCFSLTGSISSVLRDRIC